MKNFKNKNAVITGAGSGIGRALALSFASRGANVAISDVNEEGLNETAKLAQEKGVKVFKKVFDVSSNEAFINFANEVKEMLGDADVVINNAGITHKPIPLNTLSKEQFEKIMNINFWGMVYGTQAFLPQLKKSETTAVANVSSVFGLVGMPYQGAYVASKFAIRGYTEALASEMKQLSPKLQVHSIHPGGIKTNIAHSTEGATEAEKKQMAQTFKITADQAAAIIVKGIEKNSFRILIGSDAKALDMVTRISPFKLFNYGVQKLLKRNAQANS